ncbi:cyclic nucleotide-binding domain-containing protein [Candidatus Dependentiae bacterium]|nr:cyclic nucleotide-binding domain-containing protein [Candidatus Dependentiae bacterium]
MSYLQYGTILNFKNKSVIYSQNSFLDNNNFFVYFVIKGKIIIAKKLSNNNFFRIGLGKNMIFGLSESSHETKKRIISAIAVEDCELYRWKYDDFILNIQVSITLARIATYSLCRELRFLNEKKEQNFFNEQNLTADSEIEITEDTEVQNCLYNLAFNTDIVEIDENIIAKFGKTFKKNDIMIHENDVSNDFFIIHKGEAEILKNEKVIAKIRSGEIVGEMSYFDKMPRTATVRALTEVSVIVLRPENFNILYQLHPEWSIKIIKSMSNRIFKAYNDL